jgi:hypothetical protein
LITKAWDQDPQLRPTFKQLSLLFPQDANVEPMIDDLQGKLVATELMGAFCCASPPD